MKRLLLLGGGHAHLRVLDELHGRALPDWEVSLVTPQPQQVYSGMLPGWVAGHYTLDQCSIDLRRLCDRGGVEMIQDAAASLDAADRTVRTAAGRSIAFDALSIDVGSAPPLGDIAGAAEHGVFVRPIEAFIAAWESLAQVLRAGTDPIDVVIVGAGPGGVELALGLRHRAVREGWSHLQVHLAGSDALPLAGAPPTAQRQVMEWLRARDIHWHADSRATAVRADAVEWADGRALACDACWIVTGAAAPGWLGTSGLAVDDGGFVRVAPTLESVSHPGIFAAGDAASHPQALPKSGVYAVRAGEVLARNLLAHCAGEPLSDWRPQSRALYLVSAGERRAMAIWGGLAWQGRWVWRWKDGIDRRFVRQYDA